MLTVIFAIIFAVCHIVNVVMYYKRYTDIKSALFCNNGYVNYVTIVSIICTAYIVTDCIINFIK